MKGMFSQFKTFGGRGQQTSPPTRTPSQGDSGVQDMLAKAEELLKQLHDTNTQEFPRLNEATRLGEHRK